MEGVFGPCPGPASIAGGQGVALGPNLNGFSPPGSPPAENSRHKNPNFLFLASRESPRQLLARAMVCTESARQAGSRPPWRVGLALVPRGALAR